MIHWQFRKAIVPRLCAVFCASTVIVSNSSGQTVNRPRQVDAIPAGEVTIVVGEQLFNAFFDGIFAFTEPPSYPLSRKLIGRHNERAAAPARSSLASLAACESRISLARESGGMRSTVRLTSGVVLAPLAFRGAYDSGSLLGCFNFEGWAETEVNLSFDSAKQALLGRLRVRQVNIQGLSTLLGGGLTSLVQRAIDERFNPIELIKAEQLSALVPLAKGQTNSALRLRAKEVRPEIQNGELRLRILYEVMRAEASDVRQ